MNAISRISWAFNSWCDSSTSFSDGAGWEVDYWTV